MKYQCVSKKSSNYIFTLYLLIAILLNVFIIIISIVIDIIINVKYKIVINLLVLTFTILIYLWAFLVSNALIKNYRYIITNKNIETIKGSIVVTKNIININKINKIEIKRGIIGRIFKVASIKFFSNGGNLKLNYVDYNQIDKIDENVRKAINITYGE